MKDEWQSAHVKRNLLDAEHNRWKNKIIGEGRGLQNDRVYIEKYMWFYEIC